MSILQLTQEKWKNKKTPEKEVLQAGVSDLIHTFRSQGRGDAWHIADFIHLLSKPGGIENVIQSKSMLFLSMRNDKVVGIVEFQPTKNKRIYIQFMLTHPDFERQRIGRQLYSAVSGYTRTQGYKGVDADWQSHSGRTFAPNLLGNFPRPYFNKGQKVVGERMNAYLNRGVIRIEHHFGAPVKAPKNSSPFRKWWRKLLLFRRARAR